MIFGDSFFLRIAGDRVRFFDRVFYNRPLGGLLQYLISIVGVRSAGEFFTDQRNGSVSFLAKDRRGTSLLVPNRTARLWSVAGLA